MPRWEKLPIGGASPQKGFDCSGLIWWVYNKNGVKVPRITVDQARIGQSVPREQVRPGDIVVFRTSASPRGLHTGIYAGGNSFIHRRRRAKMRWRIWTSPIGAAGLSQCGASRAEPLRHVRFCRLASPQAGADGQCPPSLQKA